MAIISSLPVRQTAFTLIELVVTVAIVAILASIAFPMAEVAAKRTKEQELHTALRQIRTGLDAYKQAGDEGHFLRKPGESGYPSSLKALIEGVEDARSPVKRKLYFLRRIPRDPFATDLNISADKTWGKRSYASSADDPKEGDDVFDVYSLAPGPALNGTAYREW